MWASAVGGAARACASVCLMLPGYIGVHVAGDLFYFCNAIVANHVAYISIRVVLDGIIGRSSGLSSVAVGHECVGVGRGYERFPLRI